MITVPEKVKQKVSIPSWKSSSFLSPIITGLKFLLLLKQTFLKCDFVFVVSTCSVISSGLNANRPKVCCSKRCTPILLLDFEIIKIKESNRMSYCCSCFLYHLGWNHTNLLSMNPTLVGKLGVACPKSSQIGMIKWAFLLA